MNVHPHETLVRELFEALSEHDLATLQLLLAPGFIFHLPGRHPEAGDHRGCEGMVALWTRLVRCSAGSFEVKLLDVLVSSSRAAALCLSVARRGGKALESRAVCELRFEDSRVAEGWLYTYDQHQVDAFWSS